MDALIDIEAAVKAQILTEMVEAVKPENGWKALVVDNTALSVLSSCCRMFDLMDRGVSVVEDLAKARQPMREFEAIYMMAPTVKNVDLLSQDFKGKPLYAAVHLYFTDVASDEVIASLGTIGLRKAIKCVKELNLNFVASEAQVFTVHSADAFKQFYSSAASKVDIEGTAEQIASACASLGECPVVRYSGDSDVCTSLGHAVQRRLDELQLNDSVMKSAAADKQSQLLIIDRHFDMMSPLLHELTYQAAAYDLCNVTDNEYAYQFEGKNGQTQTKKVVLGERDEMWDEFRHAHVSTVFSGVAARFKEFENKSHDKSNSNGKIDVKQLGQMMKDLPQHQEKLANFSLHLDLTSRIIQEFTAKVQQCVEAEQNMCMGEDSSGRKIKDKDMVGQISDFLDDRHLSPNVKLRAIAVCVLASGGIEAGLLTRLLEIAEIPTERHNIVYNMEQLGAVVRLTGKAKAQKQKVKRTKRTKVDQIDMSRWTPFLKDLVEDAIIGKLDATAYPCTRGKPVPLSGNSGSSEGEPVQSARKRGGWAKGNKKDKAGDKGETKSRGARNRVIVFVPGAIVHSEVRVVYEVTKEQGVDVVIGSHHVATPTQFLEKLGTLSTLDTGGNADKVQMQRPTIRQIPESYQMKSLGDALQIEETTIGHSDELVDQQSRPLSFKVGSADTQQQADPNMTIAML